MQPHLGIRKRFIRSLLRVDRFHSQLLKRSAELRKLEKRNLVSPLRLEGRK